jgi:hypothetical protein
MPPGQAKKGEETAIPPGQAKRPEEESVPPGQAKRTESFSGGKEKKVGNNGNGGTAEPPSQAAPKVKDKASAPAPVAQPVPAEPPVDKAKDKPKP